MHSLIDALHLAAAVAGFVAQLFWIGLAVYTLCLIRAVLRRNP